MKKTILTLFTALLINFSFSVKSSEINTISISLKEYGFITKQLSSLKLNVGFPTYLIFENGILSNTLQHTKTENIDELLELIKSKSKPSYNYSLNDFSKGIPEIKKGEVFTVVLISGGNNEQKCGPCEVELKKLSNIDSKKEKISLNEVFINISL